MNFVYKIVAIVVAFILVAAGAFYGFNSYTNLKRENGRLELQVESLETNLIELNKTKEANEKLWKEKVEEARLATESAISNAQEAEKNFLKVKDEKNTLQSQYDSLVADGYRLRDTFKASDGDSNRVQRGSTRSETDHDSEVTIVSHQCTSSTGLSEGLSRFLINRAINADAVVEQLKNVQDYAKKQHQWILDNCNAVEAQ